MDLFSVRTCYVPTYVPTSHYTPYPSRMSMSPRRYSDEHVEHFVSESRRDSFCILRNHLSLEKLARWQEAFSPLLERHFERQGQMQNRGSQRFYVALPFTATFAEPGFFEDEDVLAIVEKLAGADFTMVQLATDTPLRGSDYQELHRDAPPLFPEWDRETPSFQLAVNFPLIDVTEENGPFDVARGTHMMSKGEALRRLESGEVKLEPVLLKSGDVMIRDVRHLHRAAPRTARTLRDRWSSSAIVASGTSVRR